MTTQTPQSFSTSGGGSDPTLTTSEGGASVRERAAQVGGTAKDEAAGVAQEVKYQARDLMGEARSQVRQQVDTQKGRISDLLREISDDLEQMAGSSDRNGLASEIARQVAVRVRDARGYLDGGGDVVEDVRRFARRRPGTFLLGALAAGVLAGRTTRAAGAARRQQAGSQPFASDSPGYQGEYTGYGTGTAGTAGYAGTTGYPATGYSGTAEYSGATPSSAPASGYAAAPPTAPAGTAYGTTAAGTGYQSPSGAVEYDDAVTTTRETPGTAPGYGAAEPEGTLPPEREGR